MYFTAVVEFATPVPAGAFSAANITVAAAAPFTPGSGGASCGCQQQPRRSYAPGEGWSHLCSCPLCKVLSPSLPQCVGRGDSYASLNVQKLPQAIVGAWETLPCWSQLGSLRLLRAA